jgi:hypothetical protein
MKETRICFRDDRFKIIFPQQTRARENQTIRDVPGKQLGAIRGTETTSDAVRSSLFVNGTNGTE